MGENAYAPDAGNLETGIEQVQTQAGIDDHAFELHLVLCVNREVLGLDRISDHRPARPRTPAAWACALSSRIAG